MKLRIYTDGASRGNPGPGAIAFLILDQNGKLLKGQGKFIGICTNNTAEYKALISALGEALKVSKGEVFCFSDSLLLVNQLKGEYKVKKKHLKDLFEKVKMIEKKFSKVEYKNVRRTDPNIKRVDRMVNRVLNRIVV